MNSNPFAAERKSQNPFIHALPKSACTGLGPLDYSIAVYSLASMANATVEVKKPSKVCCVKIQSETKSRVCYRIILSLPSGFLTVILWGVAWLFVSIEHTIRKTVTFRAHRPTKFSTLHN